MTLRIAAAQYPITRLASWDAYVDKASRWVAEAAWAGARLLVFPEYGGMELAALTAGAPDARAEAQAVAALAERVVALFAELARKHDVHILAPTLPVAAGATLRNTAYLLAPGGAVGVQEKLVMTRFERESWDMSPGRDIRVFDTALGRIGVAICYDVEFPLIARRQAEAGALLILAPSCTDTMAGYHRVRVGAQARALENQCYVVQSPTVGAAPWSASVDVNVGAAAVFVPPDVGMPEDGVLAMGSLDEPQWLFAELDLDALDHVRRHGQMLNHAHWPEHVGLGAAAIVPLA